MMPIANPAPLHIPTMNDVEDLARYIASEMITACQKTIDVWNRLGLTVEACAAFFGILRSGWSIYDGKWKRNYQHGYNALFSADLCFLITRICYATKFLFDSGIQGLAIAANAIGTVPVLKHIGMTPIIGCGCVVYLILYAYHSMKQIGTGKLDEQARDYHYIYLATITAEASIFVVSMMNPHMVAILILRAGYLIANGTLLVAYFTLPPTSRLHVSHLKQNPLTPPTDPLLNTQPPRRPEPAAQPVAASEPPSPRGLFGFGLFGFGR